MDSSRRERFQTVRRRRQIIDFERVLHIFAEPSIQTWAQNKHAVMDIADWIYLNGHFIVTLGVLIFIYLRRNDSFYFVRNMFVIAMGIALIGYWLYPTAPPRLMPEWGFTDSISQFLGVNGSVHLGPAEGVRQPVRGGAVDARVLRGDDRLARWPRLVNDRVAKIAWGCTRC